MKLHTGSCNGFFLFVGVVVLVSFCQSAVCSSFSSSGPHGAQSQQQQQHWRKLLQLVEQERPYNGSVVLGTYPQLNGTGAGLRKLLPAVSGYVPKAGSAEALTWSQKPHYAVAREAIFLNWRQQEMTNPAPQLYAGQQPTCAAARHPPVPFHHCHVFVNHQYKVAYIRSPKSASTSIMNWMGQCRYNKTRNWNSTTCLNYSWWVLAANRGCYHMHPESLLCVCVHTQNTHSPCTILCEPAIQAAACRPAVCAVAPQTHVTWLTA